MIPQTETKNEPQSWQNALRTAITDPKELWTLLDLDPSLLPGALAAAGDFPLRVPRSLVARMQKGNIHDPLLRQILPLGLELTPVAGYSKDPLQETAFNPAPGLLHKYQGRVLLTVTSACAVNCRYCFRRHFPYEDNNPGRAGWEQAYRYIAQDTSIHEVILSGGDPLLANDNYLSNLITQLAQLPQVTTLRIHTRLPVVLPERITPELCTLLTQTRLKAVLVLHSNHPHEIDTAAASALCRLRQAGVMLLNQSVLLQGINSDVATLKSLSETLFQHGVLPYYLHALDKVQGAAHFDHPAQTAQQLVTALREQLPGYLVPRLVCEQAGAKAKTPLGN